MKLRAYGACLLWGLVSLTAHAVPYHRYPGVPQTTPAVAPDASPDQILRRGIDRLSGFMAGAEHASPTRIRAFLDQEISGYFDFEYMAQWAGGTLYRDMDERGRNRFVAKLRELFMQALARNLGAYAQPLPRVNVYRTRPGRWPNEAVVSARVVSRSGYPMRLDFRLYQSRNGWRVFDVTANGTSAVTYYRRHFADLARRHGREALTN